MYIIMLCSVHRAYEFDSSTQVCNIGGNGTTCVSETIYKERNRYGG